MEDMLKVENVQILDKVENWEEAIQVSVQPLVEGGYCEPRYIDGILENTKKYGPYYVLCENFALIHASADQGVLKTQLAITLLKAPVKFKKDGYDVRLLIALAANDSESHMQAMQAISTIFTDEAKIQELVDATSAADIYKQFIAAANDQ